jgi:hypothetical protein
MSHEYTKLIAEFDKTLKMLRKQWIEAKIADKPGWMERINSALDERLRLMELRDGLPV